MSRTQRVVRLTIRLLMPVMVLGSLGAVAGTVAAGFEQQRDISSVRSPDGRYSATLVYGFGGCSESAGSSKETMVYVERRWAVFKTGIFTAFCTSEKPEKVVFHWDGSRTLRIDCRACSPEAFRFTETNWGNLRFAFDLNQP